ncbi:hypothetical protein TU94_28195 [Streptomyces cyaneogriseus subsp. noncyanogenus]|uniref:Uncharacterized protein n=1 Tax=Streptomyces cyaneogriseus subsp. noncyanogenus TaxID=477245 RepID=A0A0C5FXF3_9ACTN|nr:helix-turn-helix domain-containing protein [Streptomyces cyaneogriseus]AJP04752.1 hypothetical protein TU94_28195 [Streptomyces cyaneogriseus subsp. noncyanogenus]
MTTAAKPLPPHGSQARYKGTKKRPPCRCRTCISGWTKAGQRRQLLRLAGKPASLNREEVAAVIGHIKACLDTGMSQCLIGRRAGVAQSTISRLITRGDTGCLRAQGERILAVRPGDFDGVSDRPSLATVRRVRALYYAGHGPQAIRKHAPITLTIITEIAGAEYEWVSPTTETAIRRACAELAGVQGTSHRARDRALREGWAPLSAWDEDTLGDPSAHPEWTGYCGTDRGWWIHQRQQLPMCARCQQAHAEWMADHAHLDGRERARALLIARTTATSREADLAADARELLHHGVDIEQAAERLGVTRQHLQQALRRHPENREVAA